MVHEKSCPGVGHGGDDVCLEGSLALNGTRPSLFEKVLSLS